MLYYKRKAFTMIELVFVIVVLGILASIAVPRLAATRDDAQIAKGRSDVAAIRAGIVSERQSRLLKGQSNYASALDSSSGGSEGQTLFDGNSTNPILQYGIVSKNAKGHWMKTGTNTYTYQTSEGTATFTYTSSTGRFDCSTSTACTLLTK